MTTVNQRRRLRLVDHTLQQLLLVALVLMETVLVVLAIWWLYRSLVGIVDENIYRVHFHGTEAMLGQLVEEGLRVLGVMLAVNFAALVLADRIWVYYVRHILQQLDAQMEAAARLDLRAPATDGVAHAVLDQVRHWREGEARQLLHWRLLLRALPATLPATAGERTLLAGDLDART